MLSENELTDEMVRDGLAFAELLKDERLWPAVKRLLTKLNEDAISRWEADKGPEREYSRKWLRGYREALGDVTLRIVDTSNLAANHLTAAKEAEAVTRSVPDDGMGSGDLAI